MPQIKEITLSMRVGEDINTLLEEAGIYDVAIKNVTYIKHQEFHAMVSITYKDLRS